MHLPKGKLTMLLLTLIGIHCAAFGQSAIDPLRPLIVTAAQRLAIGKQVALAKWDNRTPVDDPIRESQVISAAVGDGALKGLDRTSVSQFFAAQIEANKLIQYSLLANWARNGKVPKHKPI
jgi:chorismate mutase